MLAFVAAVWLLMSPTLTGWALRTWFADARRHESPYVARMRRTAQHIAPRSRVAAPSVVLRRDRLPAGVVGGHAGHAGHAGQLG